MLVQEVILTMCDTLYSQRKNWPYLSLGQNTFEKWWQGQFLIALRQEFIKKTQIKVVGEKKVPVGKNNTIQIDICVEELNIGGQVIYIQLKERSTWWDGGAKKALTGNNSILDDINQLKKISQQPPNTTALVALLLFHEGDNIQAETLPMNWNGEIDTIKKNAPFYCEPITVSVPKPNDDEKIIWLHLYFFKIW